MILPRLHGAFPTRRELPWLLAGVVIAVLWFSFNRSLPPLFRGDVCCDSTGYVKIAAQLPGVITTTETARTNGFLGFLTHAFTYTGYTPPGFPLFLGITHTITNALSLDLLVGWVTLSLFIGLILHVFAGLFFYRSLIRWGFPLHPAALFLLTAHPGLTSQAAIPLADSLAITLMMIGIGSLCRAVAPGKQQLYWSFAAGVLLALTVFTRTSHLPAVIICIVGWLLLILPQLRKKSAALLLPAACACAFAVILSPRFVACSREAHTFCYSLPEEKTEHAAGLLREGLKSARTYTVLAPDFGKLVSLTDPFLRQFSAICPIDSSIPLQSFLSCSARHPALAFQFGVKKIIGLFDNFHLNSYATYVTPTWVIIWNRFFGVLGFVGFFSLLGFALVVVREQKGFLQRLAPFLYPAAFAGYSSILMVESRFGLPLAPFGVAGATLLIPYIFRLSPWKKIVLLLAALAAALFLIQVLIWDASDPLQYVSIERALRSDQSPPHITMPLREVTGE